MQGLAIRTEDERDDVELLRTGFRQVSLDGEQVMNWLSAVGDGLNVGRIACFWISNCPERGPEEDPRSASILEHLKCYFCANTAVKQPARHISSQSMPVCFLIKRLETKDFPRHIRYRHGQCLTTNLMTSLKGKSILIIDDDQAMLRALTKVLAGEGGEVRSASWAGEAMDHLTDRFERFDLVITDLRMPILGGETILRAVKTALPDLPVIVITAFGNPDLRVDCLSKGAAAFLEKPLETPQLLEAIDDALARIGTHPAQPTHDVKRADKSDESSSRGEWDPFKPWGGP